ncbi:hypothetical protein EVAR_29947_1 [Eumeta japonica]|uniref:Uncharacterized protein n=1 Tax=Eumeta variegata TaxID=151549 RepID=A0A4C1VFV0_EUMVA|nr:hypothetical protein EVAR_29947_1 [Eumeta japonica]
MRNFVALIPKLKQSKLQAHIQDEVKRSYMAYRERYWHCSMGGYRRGGDVVAINDALEPACRRDALAADSFTVPLLSARTDRHVCIELSFMHVNRVRYRRCFSPFPTAPCVARRPCRRRCSTLSCIRFFAALLVSHAEHSQRRRSSNQQVHRAGITAVESGVFEMVVIFLDFDIYKIFDRPEMHRSTSRADEIDLRRT